VLFPGGQRDTVQTNVALVRFTLPEGRFRCSGTLIAPTVVLTAGHCAEGPATNVYVSFETDLQPDPLQPGISPAERAAREAHYITGTAHPDPGWDSKLSLAKQHDQGVVVLDAPASTKWPGITLAPLPRSATWTATRASSRTRPSTLVGYGVDIGDKKAQIVVQERRFTTSYLKKVQDEVVVFQINANDSKAGGGSCFGDSGGGVPGWVRAGRCLLCELADLQRHRQLPAGRHALLPGLPQPVPEPLAIPPLWLRREPIMDRPEPSCRVFAACRSGGCQRSNVA